VNHSTWLTNLSATAQDEMQLSEYSRIFPTANNTFRGKTEPSKNNFFWGAQSPFFAIYKSLNQINIIKSMNFVDDAV